tara:strand:- start:1334 stop:1723 length:390 start_codon:yes stop_codon:yes gene_type:complete
VTEPGEIAAGVEDAAAGLGFPAPRIGCPGPVRAVEPALAVNVGAADGKDAGDDLYSQNIAATPNRRGERACARLRGRGRRIQHEKFETKKEHFMISAVVSSGCAGLAQKEQIEYKQPNRALIACGGTIT